MVVPPPDTGLDDELHELKEEIRKQREADVVAHGDILSELHKYDTKLQVSGAHSDERLKAETSLRRQFFALSLLVLSTATGLVAWAATEFRSIHRDVQENTTHFTEFQAIGIRWGDDIDARAVEMQLQIRDLRKQVNELERRKN